MSRGAPRPLAVAAAWAVACAGIAAPACDPRSGSLCDGPVHLNDSASGAFVHLFEWTWSDVAQECEEWLGPKGFTAVQVSPPNDHIAGEAWWTRYQPVTYNLTSRSGDEAAFVDMVQRCNRSGVGIYVDVVANHIAANSGTSIAGNPYGNRRTPIYAPEDLHHDDGSLDRNCAITDFRDKHNVQYCDLEGLPDLCTGCDAVQDLVSAYMNRLRRMGVAGFRIDAAKHMDAGELGRLLGRVAGEFMLFQEVIEGPNEAVTADMYYSLGRVTEFNYARQLAPNILAPGKLGYLGDFGEGWGFMPSSKAVVFLDNHDTQRGEAQLTYKRGQLYKLANIFMLAHPYGYPKVMSSYDFSSHDQGPPSTAVHGNGSVACGSGAGGVGVDAAPWVCEHRWTPIANMVAWRRTAGTAPVTHFQAPGGDTIALCRGAVACVALNRQESAAWSVTLSLPLPPGKYCDVIQGDDPSACQAVEVRQDGSASLEVPPLGAVAVHSGRMRTATMELIM